MKDISSLKLFTRVARLGSFSAAARECGLSQSQVSRIVADLETTLGARLLQRSTRAVVPTESGAEFLARLETILAALDDAEQNVREGGELRGILRIASTTSVALREIIPRMAEFVRRHPVLHVQLTMDDKWQDMVREAVDVGFRVGRLPDTDGTAKLIKRIPRVVVASPSYLEQFGVPEHPSELTQHRIIGGPASAVATAWTFNVDGEQVALDLAPHISFTDNEGAVAAATSGMGITSTTLWGCRRELENGQLVALFDPWMQAQIPVHAYFPMGASTRLAARAFVEFITEALRDPAVIPSTATA